METVDNYFYLGGKKATVVSKDSAGNEKVLVSEFSDKSNKLHEIADLEFVVPKYGYQNTTIFEFTKNVNRLYSSIVKDAEEQLLQGKSLEKIGKTRKIIVSNPLFSQCKESLLVRKIHGSQ